MKWKPLRLDVKASAGASLYNFALRLSSSEVTRNFKQLYQSVYLPVLFKLIAETKFMFMQTLATGSLPVSGSCINSRLCHNQTSALRNTSVVLPP